MISKLNKPDIISFKKSSDRPSSEAQKLSQKENFALFTLYGMKANLLHLKGIVSGNDYHIIEYTIERSIEDIKRSQHVRKLERQKK